MFYGSRRHVNSIPPEWDVKRATLTRRIQPNVGEAIIDTLPAGGKVMHALVRDDFRTGRHQIDRW